LTASFSKSYSSSSGSEYNPARLNLGSSAGSQAAQAATLGAMSTAERDIAAATDALNSSQNAGFDQSSGNVSSTMEDSHRHEGNVSLHSAMQSSVPEPYAHDNRSPNHLNMPAGGEMQQMKMHSSERVSATEETGEHDKATKPSSSNVGLSQRERLKKAVKEYGATVIVFHTALSLSTLGIAYLAVSSGVDVIGLLEKVGVGQSILDSKVATGASTFVIAYAAHKVFAPARIAVTLTATPFIVHYLRRIGILKVRTPKP